MTEIRRKRRRSRRTGRSRHEDKIPVIDPIAVRAWLDGLLARWTVSAICVFLAAALLLVFGQVINHEFIDLGDKTSVYENPLVTRGLNPGGIFHALTHIDRGFYAPLTVISHMTDWQFYNQYDPGAALGHHLTNALLHGTTVILLFLALRLVTGAIWRSAFVAALFAIHPLQVESVSWVSGRGDVLCGLFFVLAISAYIRYVYRPWSLMRYLAVMAMFILGLMSQPTLVVLPFVLLLLDYWPLARYSQPVYVNEDGPQRQDFLSVFMRLVTEKIPFFAVSFLAFMIALIARRGVHDSLDKFSLAGRISNVTIASITYIFRAFYPGSLTVFYPHAAAPSFFVFVIVLGLLFTITVAALFLAKKHPYLIVGWLWYLGMLVPAIGWGAGGLYAGSGRYVYLAGIGLFIIVAWGAWDVCASLSRRKWAAGGAMLAVLVALIICARIQCSYWRDGESLWNHALESTTDNYVAYNNLGLALVAKERIDDGIAAYQKAIDLQPDYAEAHDNFGTALIQKGNPDEAISHFQKALEIRPNFPEACIHMGIALSEKDRPEEAIPFYNRALEIDPDYAEAHYNLGMVLAMKKDLPGAIFQFQKALDIRPNYPQAYFNLGMASINKDDYPGAISFFKKALEVQPNYPEADFNLGIAFFRSGDVDDAMIHWQKALVIQPNYEEAHYNLGTALVQQGNLDEAIAHYQKALEIEPYSAEVYKRLGATFLLKKEYAQAVTSFEKAVEFKSEDPEARNDLAWVLATCANKSIRDGSRAVDVIQKAIQLSGDKYPALFRTLAAAYAETGHFPEAVEAAQRALKGYNEKTEPQAIAALRDELKLYEAGAPFHDTP